MTELLNLYLEPRGVLASSCILSESFRAVYSLRLVLSCRFNGIGSSTSLRELDEQDFPRGCSIIFLAVRDLFDKLSSCIDKFYTSSIGLIFFNLASELLRDTLFLVVYTELRLLQRRNLSQDVPLSLFFIRSLFLIVCKYIIISQLSPRLCAVWSIFSQKKIDLRCSR